MPKATYRIALAGVRGGKTLCGCTYMASRMRQTKNKNYMLIAPTYKLLWQASAPTLRMILERMHPNWIVHQEERFKSYWRDRNGNIVWLRSADKPDSLRGPTLYGFLFDEAAMTSTSHPWRILKQRIATERGGFGIITTTPKGANWLVRECIKPAKAGDPNYHFVKWSSLENPTFDRATYEEDLKYTDPRWVAQEYNADITDFGGLVFPDFNEDLNTGYYDYDENLPLFWGVDFGINNPTYIGYFQFDYDSGNHGKIIQIDELEIRDKPFPDVLVEAVDKGYKLPDWVNCDPSGRYREKITGIGCTELFDDLGIPVVFEDNWNIPRVRMMGILETHKYLKEGMLVHDRNKCPLMIQAYSMYSRKERPEGSRAEEMPIKDGVSDHRMESMFYFMLGKPYCDNTIDKKVIEKRRRERSLSPSSPWTGF